MSNNSNYPYRKIYKVRIIVYISDSPLYIKKGNGIYKFIKFIFARVC